MVEYPSYNLLRRQINAYGKELPHYKIFATALKRVIEAACRANLPQAVVRSRYKDVSSFAEKCVRKFDRYPDAVHQMTDLCGVRVIVQTQSQVESVRRFVEQNFVVVETEDIGLRLGEKEFGYRDRHYVVRLKLERARTIGFKANEIEAIGQRRAELQIRTWAQHAWADTLHTRTYKPSFMLSHEASRTAALLAALMEDGDRNFERLANELDGLMSNYAAYADKATVKEELLVQEFLLKCEPDANHKPRLALRLARLHNALGDYGATVQLLEPLAGKISPVRHEIDLELGTALCRGSREKPTAAAYLRGRALLQATVERLAELDLVDVPDLRTLNSLHARALSRLGWAWEAEQNHDKDARLCYRKAVECEPGNPYYLADMIGFELCCAPDSEITASMATNIASAISVCGGHASTGIELPFAYFTAGRLRLLLGEKETALHDYLRGARHCLQGEGCFGCEVIDQEISWLYRVNRATDLPQGHRWAKELLLLAKAAKSCAGHGMSAAEPLPRAHAKITEKVLIIAGGAVSIGKETIQFVREPLNQALRSHSGTVISGGTRIGIPGLVGEIAAKLARIAKKSFRLVGYHPPRLPADAPLDGSYDELVQVGEGKFSPDQILANWTDILRAGIKPEDVRLLGVGGGPISAVEYRVALTLGATVAVVKNSGGSADELLADPLWKGFPNLLPLPFDAASLRAFLEDGESRMSPGAVTSMARAFHADYVTNNQHRLPDNLRRWEDLDETFVKANLEQARFAMKILEWAGFIVRPKSKRAMRGVRAFTAKEIELMAALEHGRWNVERLRDGWRPGQRDNEKKTHDCLTSWKDLSDGPEGVRRHDRNSVKAYPRILAQAGLAIYRRRRTP